MNVLIRRSTSAGLKDICDMGTVRCSTVYPNNISGGSSCWGANNTDDDMCQLDDSDDIMLGSFVKFNSVMASGGLNKVKSCFLSLKIHPAFLLNFNYDD